MRLIRLLLLGLVLSLPALGLDLPGIDNDAATYARAIAQRYPAGATAQQRREADARIEAARVKKDPAALVAALEDRIAAGDAPPGLWLDLAAAQLRRTPPDAAHALAAAWNNYQVVPGGEAEIPALLLVADALRVQGRDAQAIAALEAVVERAPSDARYRQRLADARRAAGLLVARIRTEAEAEPARACLAFSSPLSRRGDLHVEDWVTLDPPLPQAAITRERDQLCISGLPLGRTTTVRLRAGLPGEDGLALHRDTTLRIAMGNRKPRIAFDTRAFLLPAGQDARVTVATMNISTLRLQLVRVSERGLVPFTRMYRLGEAVSGWAADDLANETGRVVWEGTADIPRWEENRFARTALPLPEALRSAGPGVYALIARPGDGSTTDSGVASVQMILRTDIALTVYRGADGLTVQARSFADAQPKPGVRLSLIARNNDILAEAETGADGVARFAAPLLRGEGAAQAVAVHGLAAGDDFVALDLEAAAFDLSDRGVTGLPQPGPLDAFLWTDRGIYRPGETVRLRALLRDSSGAPADLPVRLTVRRPNGLVFTEIVPPRGPDASLDVPVALSPGAPAGTWVIEAKGDPGLPPVGRVEFRVDAFVPERMAVDLPEHIGPLVPGTPLDVPVTARFLYGAPASGLSGTAELTLVPDAQPFPQLAGYRFGLVDEAWAPDTLGFDLPQTDAEGRTTLPLAIARAPDTTRPLKGQLVVSIDEPSGRASHARAEIPIRATGTLIGIRPAFEGNAIDAGGEAAFDILAVTPEGAPRAAKLRLSLVRERPDWRVVIRGSLARYETVWRDEPVESQDIRTGAEPLRFARRLDYGRYRLEVVQPDGLAATSVRFRAGWAGSESPDVPDRVDVSADRRAYTPGEVARIRVAPPFAGQMALTVLTDRVLSLRNLTVPAEGMTVDVPVDAAWGPGAWVAATVVRPEGAPEGRPGRAIGLVWVGIDPAARTLPLAIETPDRLAPRARAEVPVRTAPGAWVTLAAVDEGVLRLTGFATPDPVAHYLGRRRLGIDIRDDYGRLIAPADGTVTVLRQGGDETTFALPDIPQRVVALSAGPVQAGPDGLARVPVDIPDFAGELRLMAVGWQGNRIGASAKPATVRDAMVAEVLLPRFLAPGDEARPTVLLHNLDLPAGEVVADLAASGPLEVASPARIALPMAQGARATPSATLRATGVGPARITLTATGPGGFQVQREATITVRPARGNITVVAGGPLAPGASLRLAPDTGRFVPGSWRATASFGAAVRFDPAPVLRALERFPLPCVEQRVSQGLPLALLPDGGLAGEDRVGRLQRIVESVLDRQRFDGAFALWTANGSPEPWLSGYASEFLLRARAAGAAVPDQAMNDALRYLGELAEGGDNSPAGLAAQTYALYALSLGGQPRAGAARVLAERLEALPTPLAKAQLGATLARANDRGRAEAAFAAALADTNRRFWIADYGTALRDAAAIAVLVKESGLMADRLEALVDRLPAQELEPERLSTQEQAWAVAAAAVLGRDGRVARITLDGRPLDPAPTVLAALDAPATARNAGDRPVWESLAVTGVPAQALPAARDGMRVSRRFYAMDGTTLDLDQLRQNTRFVLLIEGRAETGQAHQAMLMHGLPAGWEIAARLGSGEAPGMPWLGTLSEADATPALDDRFAAVFSLTGDEPAFRTAVILRAVTPGTYELPGAELSDMYRPAVFARQAAGRITVLPAE